MCRKLFSTKINSSLYLIRLTNTWTILLEKLLERMERKRCFDRWFEVFDSQYPRNSKGYDVTFVENCFSTKLAIGLGSINEHMDDLGWRRHEQLLRWNKDEGRRCWANGFQVFDSYRRELARRAQSVVSIRFLARRRCVQFSTMVFGPRKSLSAGSVKWSDTKATFITIYRDKWDGT